MHQFYFRFAFLFVISLFFGKNIVFAQETFPKPAVKDERTTTYAFENARIFKDYKTEWPQATLVIRDGKILSCGPGVVVPADAVRVDCSGKTIYPGFVDLYAAGFSLPEPVAVGKRAEKQPQMLSNKQGPYSWNEALKPEFRAVEAYKYDAKQAEEYLKSGFTTLLVHQPDGISRGTGVLVSPINEAAHSTIIASDLGHFLSFRKGKSTQGYPSSLMGCIALLRQTHIDGLWYKENGKNEELNLSLEAWNRAQSQPQFFQAEDLLDVLRIGQLGKEFGQKYLIRESGQAYQRAESVKQLGMPLVVSVDFPEAPSVRDPFDALEVSLTKLKHWELAPTNLAQLERAGISFALTADGLKKKSQFLPNLKKAVAAGLSPSMALHALTLRPAELIGKETQLGSLDAGKLANFILTDGQIFDKESKILATYSQGVAFQQVLTDQNLPKADLGLYTLTIAGDMAFDLEISGKPEKPEVFVSKGEERKKADFSFEKPSTTLRFSFDDGTQYQLSGTRNDQGGFSGQGQNQSGKWVTWKATRYGDLLKKGDDTPKKADSSAVKDSILGQIIYPFGAYGAAKIPSTESVLIRNATVWTNEKEGILTQTDVHLADGKIKAIGKNLPVPSGAGIIDGTGKHLTAGIIDEHSHIAISRGVNEGTQESTAEVRIGDVLNSEDVNIYRQLAGGVTASQLLHGSANPIGGQSQLIKLRWGVEPEKLKFEKAPGFIKFALGENVKQSNWGENNTIRFPQTRMGVEQTFEDYFSRAQEYAALKKAGKPMRRDLDLEAIQEIIESRRFITCHSYVQSEINMLMHVAERFGFRVNTFTHILEGYKVADKMKNHGVGGSTFADWWAYKMEVYQAIPYNAALMQRQGVTVAINSDDAEMARRLNQEAAKTVKYGGVSEEEAWKMVTLNPAKLLRVDDRVGSIKVGKDADVVLWSNNPLSIYARAESTWVDGVRYFDLKTDAEKRAEMQAERARLVQKIMSSGKGGGSGEKPEKPEHHYHCDTIEDEG